MAKRSERRTDSSKEAINTMKWHEDESRMIYDLISKGTISEQLQFSYQSYLG